MVPCPKGSSCLPFNATINTCQNNNETDGKINIQIYYSIIVVALKVLALMKEKDWNAMIKDCIVHYNALVIAAGVWILKMELNL